MLNAFGFFGGNLVAPGAIGGFSAAGALLVALATAVPMETAVGAVAGTASSARPQSSRMCRRCVAGRRDRHKVREHAALTASHQGVFDLDLHTGLVSLSAEAAELLGLPPGAVELSRETWAARIHPEDRETFSIAMESYRHHPGVAFRIEFRVRGQGGRIVWFELRATMTGQSTEAERCLGLIADVTARKNAETPKRPPGRATSLTGLGTRAALISFLDASPDGLKRSALALFDVERFKAINDSLGQHGGDALLVALVERVEAGLVARPGTLAAGSSASAAACLPWRETDVADLASFGRRIFDMLSAPFFDQRARDLCPGQRRRRGGIEGGARPRSSVQRRTRAGRSQARRREPRRALLRHARQSARRAIRLRSIPICGARSSATRSKSTISRSCG